MINESIESRDGSLVIVLFEGFNLFDVGDVVLHAGEGGEGLCGDGVSEVLLDLHGDLNGVQ